MKNNLKFVALGIALLISLLAGVMIGAGPASSAIAQSGNQTIMAKNKTSTSGTNMTGSVGSIMAKNATK
ncbi:MAG: hypothetical protein JO297_21335 [Nitrososphaeraceae archaeon]|nr:hypothetical protein [Nitrososphaeraceae archaeon]